MRPSRLLKAVSRSKSQRCPSFKSKHEPSLNVITHINTSILLRRTLPFSTTLHSMSVTTKATIANFGGKLLKLSHNAKTTKCEMGFNLFLPSQATINPLHKVPLLIYLAGLTCTGDNGAEKGFFQHKASQRGIAVLYPDTSPSTTSLILSFLPSVGYRLFREDQKLMQYKNFPRLVAF